MSADLKALSERANRFSLRYDKDDDTLFSGGPGSDVIAFGLLPNDAAYLCALWNEHRSGSLIPASTVEDLKAALAEARDWIDPNLGWEAAAVVSHIDALLAAEPGARG